MHKFPKMLLAINKQKKNVIWHSALFTRKSANEYGYPNYKLEKLWIRNHDASGISVDYQDCYIKHNTSNTKLRGKWNINIAITHVNKDIAWGMTYALKHNKNNAPVGNYGKNIVIMNYDESDTGACLFTVPPNPYHWDS